MNTRRIDLPEETYLLLLSHADTLDLKSKQKASLGSKVIASIEDLVSKLIDNNKGTEER